MVNWFLLKVNPVKNRVLWCISYCPARNSRGIFLQYLQWGTGRAPRSKIHKSVGFPPHPNDWVFLFFFSLRLVHTESYWFFTCCFDEVATPKLLICQGKNGSFYLGFYKLFSTMSCSFRCTGLAPMLIYLKVFHISWWLFFTILFYNGSLLLHGNKLVFCNLTSK